MKNRISAVLLALLFCGAAYALFREQAGEAYFKTGKELYARNSPAAAGLLERASRLACGDPAAHYHYAAALQKEAAAVGGNEGALRLLDARAALRRALDLRSDAYLLNALGRNYLLELRSEESFIAYNAAFFLSQDAAAAAQWHGSAPELAGPAALHAFRRGELGNTLMLLYNRLTGYQPFASNKENPAAALLADFFRALPPERWLAATVETDGPLLKRLYAERNTWTKAGIGAALESAAPPGFAAWLEAQ